jgi:MoaA/NifB/PqqE/SkfB family radical SAM enzyme
MPNINLSTYCPLPFNGYDSRLNWVCCVAPTGVPFDPSLKSHAEIKTSPRVIQLQQDLLNGIKSPECQSCWTNESLNVTSLRKTMLEKLNSDHLLSDEQIEKAVTEKNLKYLWINSGTVCNLACRTCYYDYSSSLFKEYKDRHGTVPYRDYIIKKTDTASLLNEDYSEICQVFILGGEPFLNLDHLSILEEIVKQGHSKNVEVLYFTNGTVKLPQQIEHLIPLFREVKIQLSVDAVESQFEYIRTNGHWLVITPNIKYLVQVQIHNPNVQLSAQITISALNILYLEELMKWFDQFRLNTIVKWPVTDPVEYTFNIFSDQQKDYILEHLSRSKYDFSGIVAHIKSTKFSPEALAKFHQEVTWTENYKKMALQDYLPRLVDLLKM